MAPDGARLYRHSAPRIAMLCRAEWNRTFLSLPHLACGWIRRSGWRVHFSLKRSQSRRAGSYTAQVNFRIDVNDAPFYLVLRAMDSIDEQVTN